MNLDMRMLTIWNIGLAEVRLKKNQTKCFFIKILLQLPLNTEEDLTDSSESWTEP